jgi:peptidoglycan/LPS O-acetylase OafA/YrhL
MEALTLTTPALLFSAISLLLLAFTNRFLALANLIRSLHARFKESPSQILIGQISNLKRRINLIRNMQIIGLASLLLCVACMFLIYVGWQFVAQVVFGVALVLLILSLAISIWEINISVKALNLHLGDLEETRSM